jgi:hypothetical protein
MDTKTYIKTTGSAKAYVQRGMHRNANEVSWDVDYNGDNADIDLDIDYNGETTHYKAVLSNEDLANLLNIPSVNEPLENRLQNDFLVDRRVYKLEPVSYQRPMPVRRYNPIRVIRTRKYKRRPKTSSSRRKAISRKAISSPKTMRIRLNGRRNSSSSSSSRRRSH